MPAKIVLYGELSCRTITKEKRRGFQPPWYTVTIYECNCGEITTLRDNWRGPAPRGYIKCAHCGAELPII